MSPEPDAWLWHSQSCALKKRDLGFKTGHLLGHEKQGAVHRQSPATGSPHLTF